MQTEPEAPDILSAVAESLMNDVVPLLPRDRTFHALVAINAIRLVERQLRLMPAAEAAERERLGSLLAVSGAVPDDPDGWNAALVERIAAGAFDADLAPLASHLWATTLDQLAIDQPRYGGYLDQTKTDREPG